ncbi:hypothetical protein EDD18DRAFT_1422999 [Armillaria luteobubalina]|uniref:AAA-ATPase-like domain-containing protein n=1 Tax=Armillaria luteobubalina TaxID=153913 RepID=A0AA39UYP4_9AGAR|nr:hypothetical protein EDD18DRAFT_1422999 [Armillaria luteobubalina]
MTIQATASSQSVIATTRPLDVECVLPCNLWPPYRVICCRNTFSELFGAAKDAHDNGCLCQLPLGDHAWVLTGEVKHSSVARSGKPPASARRVDMDEEVSKYSAEGCATVAWFFDGEDSDGSERSSSDILFSTSLTSPSNLVTRVGSKGSCGISTPIKLSQGIFKSDGNESTLPSCSLTAYRDVLSCHGVVWVDRTSCLVGLDRRADSDRRLVLVHRPTGFGKTSFLAMAEFFHDVKYHDSPESRSALLSTWIGDFIATNRHEIYLHEDLVLTFDLAATCVTDFEASLAEHVNTILRQFLFKYQEELQITPKNFSYIYEDGVYSLAAVTELVGRTDRWKVFVCIDNYNAPYLAGGDRAEIDRCLELLLVGPLSASLDDCHSGLIMGTGDEPDPSISTYYRRPSVWVSVAADLTDCEMMEGAFGFTPDEVRVLVREFNVQGVESGLEPWSFVSGCDQSYSMKEVLEGIGRQCRERETAHT